MFTGIITDQGRILAASAKDQGRLFRIGTAYDIKSIDIGASIACNGVCLTVTSLSDDDNPWFEVEAWSEALMLTNADEWQEGHIINLERSLKHGDEYGGHMVSGHVDQTILVHNISEEGDARRFFFKAPDDLMKFIVPKGSVCLDGTSLTVNKVEGNIFDVLFIRHTLEVTTWGRREVGSRINLEVDQMARYVVRILDNYQSASS